MHDVAQARNRLAELLDKYGSEHIFTILDQLKDYGEQLMRGCIRRLPDGCFHFTDYLDNDGPDQKHISIRVELTVQGDQVLADFSKSGDQVATPLNTVQAVTISATMYVFQLIQYPMSYM